MNDALALTRRWVNDYFNRHDPASARAFCAPDYTLSIGDVTFAGRDDSWLPAVDDQFRAWPGLGMTVHGVLNGGDRVAVWFSEHGMSQGRSAVWSGVAIYRATNGLLTGCVAQEDYFTRRRQVKEGRCDLADAPAIAPWDEGPGPTDPAAEAVVRDWLAGDWPRPCVVTDDEHLTGRPLEFAVDGIARQEVLSVGPRVAFHARLTGLYRGGLGGAGPVPTFLDVNGLVEVSDGRVARGRVIRDRMGLWARLRSAG
jgi:hypothetical protein